MRLAQSHQVVVMLLLHMSAEGQALGRRIRGITRTLMHLECPIRIKPNGCGFGSRRATRSSRRHMGVTIRRKGNNIRLSPPISKRGSRRGETAEGDRPGHDFSEKPWP